MALSQPIAGNESFTSVSDLSSQLPQLNVADLTAASIDGQMAEFTVTGYAPTTFATLIDGGIVSLNIAPGLPQATTLADTNLLLVPPRSIINSIFATNNGTTITSVGAATLTIGLNTTLGFGDDSGLLASPIATVNNGAAARGCSGGFSQSACLGGRGTSGVATRQVIAVEVSAADLTAGDLKVSITFYVIPPVV